MNDSSCWPSVGTSANNPIKLSTILERGAKIDNSINGSVLILRQGYLAGDLLPAGERANKAASRLALTLATMRAEFELMHAELETLAGRLNSWIEDGASTA